MADTPISNEAFLARMQGFEDGSMKRVRANLHDISYNAGFDFGRACRTHAVAKFGGVAEAPPVPEPVVDAVPPGVPVGTVVRRRRKVERVES